MDQHKCIDCGYLACRDLETRQLEEVERSEKGDVIRPCTSEGYGKYDAPICFAGMHKLQSQYAIERINSGRIHPIDRGDTSEVEILQVVLTQLRYCDRFTEWIQGLTPKEHREMEDRKWRQKHEEVREDADKKWRSRQDWKLVIVAGIFTLLGVLLSHWH